MHYQISSIFKHKSQHINIFLALWLITSIAGLNSNITSSISYNVTKTRLTSPQILFSFLSHTTPSTINETGIEVPHVLMFEKSCKTVLVTGGCKCLTRMKHCKCCCVGPQIRQIPQNFSMDVRMIFFYNVGILEIREDDFSRYVKLEEIIIDSAKEIRNVEGSAFKDLTNLRKLQISNCANLERWSNTVLRNNLKIQSVMAQNNALKRLPRMEMVPKNHHFLTMELIDFSGNSIEFVESDAFRDVASKELRLTHNHIRRIEARAFSNSKFYKIALNDNPQLSEISMEAFENILDLHHLDLSNTIIHKLPVKGLKNVNQLALKNVPTLKKLPPVLAFTNLNKAEFTYPYHCCYFKHATREYEKGREYMEHYKEIQHRVCRRKKISIVAMPSTIHSIKFSNEHMNGSIKSLKRGKRQVEKEFGDSIGKTLTQWYEMLHLGSTEVGDSVSGEVIILEEEAKDDDELEHAAYNSNELGRSIILNECVESAVSNFYLNVSCTPQPDALNPCEDIVSYYPLRYMIWIMGIGAIVGNIAVWIVIAAVWQRRMRLHYFFMLNVSFADFLTGVYLAVLAIADLKTSNEYYNYAVEWQTGWGCSAAGFISVFASQLSIYSMLLIAVEIYYNAKYALYGRRMSSQCATILMAIGYTYSFTMAFLPLIGVSSYQHSSICLPLSITKPMDQAYLLFGLSLSAIAFASMLANYILINCMIRNPETPSRDEDKQILKRTIILIGTDMICWVPTLFFGITAAMGMPLITLTNAKICLILFYPINSCANPMLYVFLTKIWKDAKRKALPIFEIISSRSQQLHQHSKQFQQFHQHHQHATEQLSTQQSNDYTVPISLHELRKQCDRISKFYYSTEPVSEGDDKLGNMMDKKINNSVPDQNGTTTMHHSASSPFLRPHENRIEADHKLKYFMQNGNIISSGFLRQATRVSVIPEMSDISESSSNSCEKLNKRKRAKRQRCTANADAQKITIDKTKPCSPRGSFSMAPAIKRDSNTSIGRDSGRGDSLTSNVLLLNRPSIVSINWNQTHEKMVNSDTETFISKLSDNFKTCEAD